MTTRSRVLLVAALLAPLAAAQARANAVYKAEFNIRDTGDPAGKSGRKYSLTAAEHVKSTFRIGNRVPVVTGGNGGNTQWQYFDLGVNIDCLLSEQEGKIYVHADADLSSPVLSDKNPGGNPTISQIKINMDTSVTPGKPTVVASFDDPVTARKFEVEVTVTKL